jgi:hypothetical protein
MNSDNEIPTDPKTSEPRPTAASSLPQKVRAALRDPVLTAKVVADLLQPVLLSSARNNAEDCLRDMAKMYAQRLDLTAEQLLSAALNAERLSATRPQR